MTLPIDTEEVLSGLKDFQRNTSEWVFERMFDEQDPAVRFLVADEVGLGKTHVAKGVIAQVIDYLERTGDERHDIVYVCSNGAIARQNLRKLAPNGVQPIDSVERLTMLPLAQLNEGGSGTHGVNLLAITPGTSLAFGSSTGRFEERVLAYTFLREVWGHDEFPERARWIFWEGVNAETGDQRLRDQSSRQRDKIEVHVDHFRRTLKAIDRQRRELGQPSSRTMFNHLVRELKWQRNFPKELGACRREFIGEIRRVMAMVGIAMLEPDLVVLDEFQRFKNLLDPAAEDWSADLARRLFTHLDSETGRPTRTLLLSATPYRMFTTSDETDGDHYADFVDTCSFLFDDKAKVTKLENQFRLLRLALTDDTGDSSAETVCKSIESLLRTVMVRTERLAATPDRDGMLSETDTTVPVREIDLRSYIRLSDLAESIGQHEPTEYWKSSPFLFNFMEKYQLKEALEQAIIDGELNDPEALKPGPGLLKWDEIEQYEQLDPQNGRLRWLIDDLDQHHAFDLLWMPPSLLYYRAGTVYEQESSRRFTKRLLFSGWAVVPKVVSTIVSYEAERHAFAVGRRHQYSDDYGKRGGRRLDFRLETRRPAAMTAFLFVWPSPTLAELGDPRPSPGGMTTAESVLNQARDRLRKPLRDITSGAPTSGTVDQRWYWAAPLLLDRSHHPRVIDDWFGMRGSESTWGEDVDGSGFKRHSAEAWALLQDHVEPLGRCPEDLLEVLAEVAVGGPAQCALRALSSVTGLELGTPELQPWAARVAWAFRSFFNAPDVTAIVVGQASRGEGGSAGGRIPYWREAIRHSIGGNLQSVLDEHTHILRDWLGFIDIDHSGRRVEAAEVIANKLAESLQVRTSSFRVDLPSGSSNDYELIERRMRSRFAVAFGNQRLESGGQARVESVSTAFNSPFWPFVLTTTSIGQEGLDFHLWCHAVVHWNLPGNPVDLEQREGRVHRFKGHAVRKNIAATIGVDGISSLSADIWEQMFNTAANGRSSSESEMMPYWVFNKGPAKIERHVPLLPFSRDAAALPRLRKSLATYRLAFGQPRQEELLEFLGDHHGPNELKAISAKFRIDLSPPDGFRSSV